MTSKITVTTDELLKVHAVLKEALGELVETSYTIGVWDQDGNEIPEEEWREWEWTE